MESKVYHYTLDEFLHRKQAAIQLLNVKIKEGDVVELFFTYPHSKNLVLIEIIKQSINNFDMVLFFDMDLSIDFSDFNDLSKILIYKIYSAPDFFMYLNSIESLIKDSKSRAILIIDSWNTYLWNEKPREKTLEFQLNKKMWKIVQTLQEKFGTCFIICKKSYISRTLEIKCSSGSFAVGVYEKNEITTQVLLSLEPIILGNGIILHGITTDPTKFVQTFIYPFQWQSFEEISN